ncbi:TonB-dependent receptor [Pontixanthobacter aestiaquae]|uniref:TonB-dependent receptor n=1 Tax=Pontixanthobacter aestiaquae TaxID=1509367 RepID=A0A844Z4J9_9SPHN|nr:TonB-dependent receptor [Pontixanthobacter aestiaquae]MDN3646591.1 TonB-dependent receptor [Pontixanthobacter aestiaquae]MXO82424.1 TonB-dependent receptor [Pontixanthobacter aestiaquae]
MIRTSTRPAIIGVSSFALLAGLPLVPAYAQDQASGTAATDAERVDDDLHDRRISPDGEIVVTAIGLTQLDVLAGTSVIEGAELQRNLDGQLGNVLAKLPGVSATGFSPGASRPVLRGFSGERVKVLNDGIGAIDASNTSDDHAVTIDPLTAERIEVLRGPAVILYGSQAIGGAVNVIDKRIPLRVPDEAFHLDTIMSADTATGLLEGGASLDVPLSDRFVVHVNGSYRNTDDIEIPGFAASDDLRADLFADAAEEEDEGELEEAEELREAANISGILPNSATETWSADLGFAFFEGESSLGAAIGIYDTVYGIPSNPDGGHHHGEEGEEDGEEEEEGEEVVTIDLRQIRADLRGKLDLGNGFFSELNTRVGFSDYTHTEFEGAEVGTVFNVSGIEARADLIQNPTDNWRGSFGIQYYTRDFEAIGAEAFVAPNRTDQFAIFGLQEVDFGNLQLEGALRYETTDVGSQTLGIDRDFDAFSGAISLAYETADGLRFGVTGSRAERAPAAEELFSNGPHIATQAFEIGDVNLTTEKAWGVEAFVRGNVGPASISFAVFQNWFDDYISLFATGQEEDDLPVFQYVQADANYFGIEGEIRYNLIDTEPLSLRAELRGDYIDAELTDGTPLPRIPALNFLGALEAEMDDFDIRGEVQWFDGQDSVAPFETATDSFTFVNASIAWRPLKNIGNITLMLQAENIFDVEGRRHSSFTKEFVPLTGRNFKVSLRSSF